MTPKIKTLVAAAIVATGLGAAATNAHAAEVDAKTQAIYDDIQKTFGGVPTFVKQVPPAAIAGLWQQTKELELSDKTALPPKTKALIALAVASQIPCTYCIWADTNTAKSLGASDQEIGEAVAMAGLTRQWSTMFNGLQVDLEQFKKEMGGGS
jgi:AhpD family alkylhydroperoxidase